MNRRLRTLGLALLVAVPALGAEPCSSACESAFERSRQVEKSLRRLGDIRAVNLEFIAKLDASQGSQRIKAASNVRIAEKRIADAQLARETLEQQKKAQRCDTCKGD